jgi:hypothetical protein
MTRQDMTEAEWLATSEWQPMTRFLAKRKKLSSKISLFEIAWGRLVWNSLTEQTRMLVERAERFPDGTATVQDRDALGNPRGADTHLAHASRVAFNSILRDAYPLYNDAFWRGKGIADILRDLFGNPFRPVTAEPHWLTWNGGTISTLAQAVYGERQTPQGTLDNTRLAVLADALEEAGCTNADILDHCRQPGTHVRGCWVVDLLLGKE